MFCPSCGTDSVPMPERTQDAICANCSRAFRETADLGWWSYTVEVYTPVDEERES